jgi:hypothetical protein
MLDFDENLKQPLELVPFHRRAVVTPPELGRGQTDDKKHLPHPFALVPIGSTSRAPFC